MEGGTGASAAGTNTTLFVERGAEVAVPVARVGPNVTSVEGEVGGLLHWPA